MKNLKTTTLSSLLVFASIAAFTSPAMADIKWNGPILQGIQFNGVTLQGVQFNGVTLQGVRLNGAAITDTDHSPVPIAVKLANGKMIKLR